MVIDTENDTWNKGNPFDRRFNPVCIGWKNESESGVIWRGVSPSLPAASKVVGFNLKYDIHVIRKWGIPFRWDRIWCCQVAEYLLERQQAPYPSLEGTAEKYGLGRKLDKIKQYWDQGVQTSEIPRDELAEYVLQDVELTHQIYLKQQELLKPHQRTLFRLAMLDLLCLEDIEWNGLRYDRSGVEKEATQIETEISGIQTKLNLYHSVPNFNWNSSDHLSALLFGGEIKEERRVPDGFYKTGKKAGEVKYKKELVLHHLPRMYTPKRKTETGKYSTDEDALSSLEDSDLIKGILKIKELEKLNNTYFGGMLEKLEKLNFEPGMIHANFNQCVTKTGRLSSSKPNLQNTPPQLDAHFISRFS